MLCVRRPIRLLLAVSTAASFALGCGGDDDGDDTDDQSMLSDAAPNLPDAAVPLCTDFAATDLGTLDPVPSAQAFQRAQDDPPVGNDDAKWIQLLGAAAGGEKPDVLAIELWDGFGAFDGGDVAIGDFTIAGVETAVATCGVCVYIWADATLADGEVLDKEKEYIATGGMVTIDSIEGNLTGSVSNLTFTEINASSTEGTPLEGGCETAITSGTFDVLIEAPPG